MLGQQRQQSRLLRSSAGHATGKGSSPASPHHGPPVETQCVPPFRGAVCPPALWRASEHFLKPVASSE